MPGTIVYMAIIEFDGGVYGVRFPDVPGCVTVGDTLAGAAALAKEALQFHLEGLLEDGGELPAATYDLASPREPNEYPMLIEIERPDVLERFSISVKRGDLNAIDRAAKSVGMTRSAYMVDSSIRQYQGAITRQQETPTAWSAKSLISSSTGDYSGPQPDTPAHSARSLAEKGKRKK